MTELHDSEAVAKEEGAFVDIELDVNAAELQLEGSEAEGELEETYIGFKEGVFDEGYIVYSDKAPAFNRMFLKSMIAINLDDTGWCVGRVLRKFNATTGATRLPACGTLSRLSRRTAEPPPQPRFLLGAYTPDENDDGDVGTPG